MNTFRYGFWNPDYQPFSDYTKYVKEKNPQLKKLEVEKSDAKKRFFRWQRDARINGLTPSLTDRMNAEVKTMERVDREVAAIVEA